MSSQIDHNALVAADHLNLGVVRVWGAGTVKITGATLTDKDGGTHSLNVVHDTNTEVRSVFKFSLFMMLF